MMTPTRRVLLQSIASWCGGSVLLRGTALGYQGSGGDVVEMNQDPRLVAPRPVHQEKPRYTKEALDARIEGELLLKAVVETDGSVHTVTVAKSLDAKHGLDEEGIAAARKWRFKPGTIEGTPVRVRVTIALTFKL